MPKLKNTLLTTAAAAAVGVGGVAAEKNGLFEDRAGKIEDTPEIRRKLEKTIKPKMERLGRLSIKLAKKAEAAEDYGAQRYDPKTHKVIIDVQHTSPVTGDTSSVEAEFKAIPGTEEPDPNKVLSIKIDRRDLTDEKDSAYHLALTAPGEESLDKKLGYSAAPVYAAVRSGRAADLDIDSMYDGRAHLAMTRDNVHFVDSSWPNRAHNPLPTARDIVNDSGLAADIIRQAFQRSEK